MVCNNHLTILFLLDRNEVLQQQEYLVQQFTYFTKFYYAGGMLVYVAFPIYVPCCKKICHLP